MQKKSRKTIKGYIMPSYIIDILTRGICGAFIGMSVLRENSTHVFTYDTEYYDEPDVGKMPIEDVVELLNALIAINRECEEHLIPAENYLIGPGYIFVRKGMTIQDGTKILFYPDVKRRDFSSKMAEFITGISAGRPVNETEMLSRVVDDFEKGDSHRASVQLLKLNYRYRNAA